MPSRSSCTTGSWRGGWPEHSGSQRRREHVLANWGPSKDSAGHTTFRLRPQAVRALESLNWFRRRRHTGRAEAAGRSLHIVQGGVDNGDKARLDRNAGKKGRPAYTPWVVPKSARVGDAVVVFIRGLGFYATATIDSVPKARKDWARRYGAQLRDVQLVEPPVSLELIRKSLPGLTWANYPRSITTPTPALAMQVQRLVERRTKTRLLANIQMQPTRRGSLVGARLIWHR